MVRQYCGFDPNLVDLFSCLFLRNDRNDDRDEFSRLPLNFKPLHFNHRFSYSTLYSSGSLSTLEPGTSSSSVPLKIEANCSPFTCQFFPTSLTELDFVCLSLDGGVKSRDVISAKCYFAGGLRAGYIFSW